ncbi:MAG: T9SS type A sorting domain-containing protein [Saprospiraceae bacterium]|jgi:hypothetical protein
MKTYLINYLSIKWSLWVILFLFHSTGFLEAQNPNCDLYGASYTIGASYTDCANAHVDDPVVNDFDAACENIILEVELQWASYDLNKPVLVQIQIEKSNRCPLKVIDLGLFTDNSTNDYFIFDAIVTLDENHPIESFSLVMQELAGCNGIINVVAYDKLESQSSYFEYPPLKTGNYSGPILSGSLEDAISNIFMVSSTNSCTNVQEFAVSNLLEVDVASYCFLGSWNIGGNPDNSYAHITMSPGAEIVVKEGNTLTLKNELVTCCFANSDRWKSITVETGATLIALNTTFDNGHYAINALPGSTIIVSDCYFKDAYVGIYGGSGGGPTFVSVSGKSSFTFDGSFNSTYSNEPSLEGAKPLAGIKLEDCASVLLSNIGNNVVQFNNLQYGILLKNSNLRAIKPVFSNMTSGISQFGIWGAGVAIASRSDLQNNSILVKGFGKNSIANFNNLTYGIVNRGNKIEFTDNKMTNIYTCIDHKDTRQAVSIKSNRMEPYHIGLDLAFNTGATDGEIQENDLIIKSYNDAIGINMQMDRKDWKIKQNLIESEEGLFGFLRTGSLFGSIHENTFHMKSSVANYYSGLKNEAAGSVNIFCNDFDADNSSTEAYGILNVMAPTLYLTCNSFDNYRFSSGFVNGNLNTKLRNSSYTNGYSGLVLGNQSNQMGIIGDQAHHGNIFNGGFNSNDAKCWGGANIAGLSLFLLNELENSNFLPNNPDPSSDWFKSDGGTSSISCTTTCSNGIGRSPRNVSSTDTEIRILQNPLSFEEDSIDQNWNLKFQIYELVKNGEIIPGMNYLLNLLVDNFNQDEEGDIATLEAGLRNLDTLIYQSNEEVLNLFDTVQSKHSILDTLLSNHLADYESITVEANSLQHMIDSIQALINESRLNLDTLIQDELALLYGAFPEESESTILPKQNLVRVHFLELKYLNGINLDSTELEELMVLAESCPSQNGKASYLASALLHRITGVRLSPDLTCEGNEQALTVTIKKAEISVSPNPSTGKLLINWKLTRGVTKSRLLLRDLSGKILIESEAIRTTFGSEEMDLSEYSKGIYLIELRDEFENLIDVTKVVLN